MPVNEVMIQFVGSQLEKRGHVQLKSKGTSMYPFMQDGDRCILVLDSGPYVIGEVYLYRDPVGRLIAHRLIKIVKNRYIFSGDANESPDPSVHADHIMARLIEVRRQRIWIPGHRMWKWFVLYMPYGRSIIRFALSRKN